MSDIRRNPVFWLMLALPAAAVVASFATLAIALQGADPALPAAYHWEGEALEQDFTRARRASELGIALHLAVRDGQCVARLSGAPGDPPALNLLLTSGSDAGLDRAIHLRRTAAGEYRADCAPLPAGRWRLALEDDARVWSLRGAVVGDFTAVSVRATRVDP